jgi:putative ABC transport system permease protein
MMLKHDLRLALRSFRRNPILTALTVSAIAAGIGAAMISITLYHARAGHPLWWKEHQLFAVTLDARGTDHKGEELQRHPEYPPNQVTYRDAQALYRSEIPKHSLMMYRSAQVIDPGQSGIKPFGALARVATADFFSMFDVPMRYGAGWSRTADTTPDPVVVLSDRLNDKLFNGANSVGRTITLSNKQFRVVGVIDQWMPQPKFYDLNSGGGFDIEEDLFIPFGWSTALKLQPSGNISCVTPEAKVGGFEDLLNTDCVFMQYWVEIPDAATLRRFHQYLDNYTNNQRQYGRFVRPTNNHLDDIPAWLDKNDVVGDDSRIEVVLAVVFLGVCIVNTVGLMLAKFLGAAPITGLRRALGASRKQIMHQHLVEVVLIAVIGGAVGLVLARVGLWAIKVMTYVPRPDNGPEREALANSLSHMDYRMVVLAVGISVLTGILAGTYPAWRIGRAAPASFLKAQ